MAIFEEVRLSWGGQEVVLAPDRVLGAIAVAEETITLAQLYRFMEAASVPVAKLSKAYGAVLRYAGVRVSDDDVYAGMFKDGVKESALRAIDVLLLLMVPPESLRAPAGKPQATGETPVASSPNATGSASGKAG